jgi:hypothetical protein
MCFQSSAPNAITSLEVQSTEVRGPRRAGGDAPRRGGDGDGNDFLLDAAGIWEF